MSETPITASPWAAVALAVVASSIVADTMKRRLTEHLGPLLAWVVALAVGIGIGVLVAVGSGAVSTPLPVTMGVALGAVGASAPWIPETVRLLVQRARLAASAWMERRAGR